MTIEQNEATAGTTQERVEHLDEQQCWSLLLSSQVGRLGFQRGRRTEIVPVNFVVRAHRLVFRTTSDAGLLTSQAGPVALETDGWDRHIAWSVVAHGRLMVDTDPAALAREAEIGIEPWAPDDTGPKRFVVALEVDTVSGRRFARRSQPDSRWYW
jgi:nitroimidazol reductase NimA-like FMN-containing flavoprotein (pyridoxamine 5'-phosphate oxidase superfamily)